MSSVTTHHPAAATRASERTSRRAEALADRLVRGADALALFTGTLTDVEWETRLLKDGRKIGVIVHHVASVYPIEIQLAHNVAAGLPVTGLTPADIDKMNAGLALEHDKPT